MQLFSRFRRGAEPAPPDPVAEVLPQVNKRVTLLYGGHDPVISRVDDERGEALVLASPNLPLENGDGIVLTWEEDDGWYRFETSVVDVEETTSRPSISISTRGRLTRFHDRRSDIRKEVSLPLELLVLKSRAIRPGRTLSTQTSQLGEHALQFTTSAPLAPGDLLEARLSLRAGDLVPRHSPDVVGGRLKVIRMDSVSGSWRQTCTALYDEMLRSDRSRIQSYLQSPEAVAEVVARRSLA